MRNWSRWALLSMVILAAAYYWFFVESHIPASGSYSLDMTEIRRLANLTRGPKAQSIHVEHVATFAFPSAAIMAGASWSGDSAPAVSYQIVFPGSTMIVDTAMDEKITKAMGRATFHPEAYARMTRAMGGAAMILITHEHPDHIGGLTAYPDPLRLVPAVRLTREQADHPERMAPAAFLPGIRFITLDYDRYYAMAPGIVLIKAPGHSPGSQMVFVQKEDGAEFLLLGDVAWQMRNIENVRERPRFVSMFLLQEDRDAVMRQLVELHRLQSAEPNLHMLPGHDGMPIAALEKQGLLLEGF
jgi:glyoxylase-like metal-dependent hydrolase (beta-lactamase superfamily II)